MFRRSPSDSSFPISEDHSRNEYAECKGTQVCGQRVVQKLLAQRTPTRSTASKSTTQRGSCLKSKWEQKKTASPKNKDKAKGRKEEYSLMNDHLNLSPVASLEESLAHTNQRGAGEIRNFNDPNLKVATFAASENKANKDNQRRNLPLKQASPMTKNSLQSIQETREDEDPSIEISAKDLIQGMRNSTKSAASSSTESEQSAVIGIMKRLIIDQQTSLMETELKNNEYRERLAACQEQMMDMTQAKSEMKELITNLQHERETFENEARWMKEEMMALQKDVIDLRSRRSPEANISSSNPDSSKGSSSNSNQDFSQKTEREQAHILHELRQVRAALCTVTGEPYRSELDQLKNSHRGSNLRDVKKEITMLRLQMSRFRREQKRSNTKDSKMPSWLDLEVGSETSSDQHGHQHKQDDSRPTGRNRQKKQPPSARLPSASGRHKIPAHIFPESRDESVSTLGNRSFENRIEAEARHLKLIQKKREQEGAKQKSDNGVSLNDFFGNHTFNEQPIIQRNSSPILDCEGESANKRKEASQIHNAQNDNDRDGPPPTTDRGEKEAVRNVNPYFDSSESPEGHKNYQDEEVESASHYFNTNEDSEWYAGHQKEEVKNTSPYLNNTGEGLTQHTEARNSSPYSNANEGLKHQVEMKKSSPKFHHANEGLKQQADMRNSSPYFHANEVSKKNVSHQDGELGDTSPYINANEGPKRYVHTNQGPGRWKELSRINDERDKSPLHGSEFEL